MYNAVLKRFALTLHYYSPRAYNFIRQKLDNCLPHPKTLSKWYLSVNGEPGINSESLQVIQRKVQNSAYPLVGALIFDEMAIHQKDDYVSGSVSGLIDFGKDMKDNDSDLSIAKEALAFCVVCYNQN